MSHLSSPTAQPAATSLETPKVKSPYHPHLDGLRALAIIGILFEHFGMEFPPLFRCGPLCVRFFFVLSGYFITVSLWKVQAQIVQHGHGQMGSIFRYYLARLMRIGPPFYLSLVVGAIFGIEEVRTNFFWLATFQANNYIAHLGYWPEAISHYWSLAVQEQFYLLWPLIVLTVPRRWFAAVMGGFILFGLGFRLACITTDASTITRWVTLFGCIDSFAVGALIAYLNRARLLERLWKSPTFLFAMPLAAFACFFLGRALMTLPEGNLCLGLVESADAVFLAWLMAASLSGISSRYTRILSWAPMVYVGKISYGIYVYHVFVIILVSPLLIPFGLSETHLPLGRVAVLTAVTLALASLSWHWMEKPFLAWKASLAPKSKSAEPPQGQTSIV